MNSHKIGLNTAISVVIANMIGTGVFTSLGFQVLDLHSGLAILLLWIIGGVIALCGALTYGEIGSAFPESGGEYNYLSKLYHPAIGFVSGWVSITVGFAAPIAAATVAMSGYIQPIYPEVNTTLLATLVILIITIVHSIHLKAGGIFQKTFTIIKVLCILIFIASGFFYDAPQQISFALSAQVGEDLFSMGFATSLIFVTYAYSGWNAASYISGEIKNATKNLPKALIIGTLFVAVVYTLLNYIFLITVPLSELKGEVEVGYLSATKIFGVQVGKLTSLIISVLLISTVSAMIWAGPRVMQRMGQTIHGLRFFAIANKNELPYVAIIFQSLIALALVYTASFKSLITYVSFTLNLFTFLTVFGVFILRIKLKHIKPSYRTPFYPFTPLVFLIIVLWILYHILISNPYESCFGLLTVVLGLGLYFLSIKKSHKQINGSKQKRN